MPANATLRPGQSPLLWALGAAGLVFAARLREIHLHTGDVALNDQWKIEAADILAPWLDGTLRPWAFFAPHFEHVPGWTRLATWLEVVLTGRWDPFVQTTVNAGLFAGFIALLVHWVAGHLRVRPALGVTLLIVLGSALPHAWENITWGFQSQFPFALLFLFLHLRGSFAHAAGSRRWWWAQAAGAAGLFTLAGMWIAPLAVVLVGLWTRAGGPRLRLFPLALVAAGLAIIAAIRATAPAYGAFAQTAGSPLHFLHAWLDLLGWPAAWPGALALLNLPLILFALQLRGRRDADAFDRTVLALGVWAAGQAAALAYARGADYGGYVSRYGELLLPLVFANALAFVRLAPAVSRRWPVAAVAAALVWTGVVAAGWWELSVGGHTAYFHGNSANNNRVRREAVQAYLTRGDRTRLELPGTRQVLYQDVNQVTTLLDQPLFRALLPASVNPATPPDLSGSAVRWLQARAALGAGLAGLLLVIGVASAWRRRGPGLAQPDFIVHADPLLPWLAGGTAVAATALLFCWPAPLTFGSAARWRLFFHPAGSIGPLAYHIEQGSTVYPPERLNAAAPLYPLGLRAQFAGTDPEGPALTCTAWSESFPINLPWLIVPHAGWPVSPGNGLRLRIEETDGRSVTEVACAGPNPREIGFWTIDVLAFEGRQARVVLYDGRTETEAWVAAATPIATEDPALAARLTAGLARERLAPAHQALAWWATVAALVGLASAWSRRSGL